MWVTWGCLGLEEVDGEKGRIMVSYAFPCQLTDFSSVIRPLFKD